MKEDNSSKLSFICSVPPLCLWLYCILSMLLFNTGAVVGWLFVFYYWTVGIPLFVVWLSSTIRGLRSKNRKLAVIGLINKLVYILLIIITALV